MGKDKEDIITRKFQDLIGEKFGNYSRYIIQDRALPNINDGLKPVQRRILYAMYKLKLFNSTPYKKSARIVGDVIGKYHPHGDTSVYEAMVRMSQEWKMILPLVDMHGNKGSIDGDSPAAMRYTETRLMEISQFLIGDIEKNIINFLPNFDDSELEPSVFPTIFPNLLINGSTGIASGYSTNIPPHNFNEVMEGLIFLLKNPNSSVSEIVKYIKGPDFPTGGIIETKKDILNIYKTGNGKITIKSKISYDKNKNSLVITEIPFEINKSVLVRKIDELINSTSITTIKEILDETDRNGLQISIFLKPNVNYNSVINFLMKKTDLQKSYSANLIAINNNSPQIFTLNSFLHTFITFITQNYLKLFTFELEKVELRLEIIDGIVRAIPIIDEIIILIRKSKNKTDSREKIMNRWNFTYNQAEAILNLKLYRLSSTNIIEFEQEKNELVIKQNHYKSGLNEESYLKNTIISDLTTLNAKFKFPRRTKILNVREDETETFDVKDLIKEETFKVEITKKGLIKILPEEEWQKPSKINMDDLMIVQQRQKSFNQIFLFTSKGKYYSISLFKVPNSRAKDFGVNFNQLFNFLPNEKIIKVLFCDEDELSTKNTLIISTKNSLIKRIKYESLTINTSKNGIKLIKLNIDDEVVSYENSFDDNGILNVITKKGMILRFPISNISISSLASQGVTNIKLDKIQEDKVINIIFQDSNSLSNINKAIIYVTKNGSFRKILLTKIRETSRGNKGQNIFIEKNINIINVFNDVENNNIFYLTESFKSYQVKKESIPLNKTNSLKNVLDINEKIISASDLSIIKFKTIIDKTPNSDKYKKTTETFFKF